MTNKLSSEEPYVVKAGIAGTVCAGVAAALNGFDVAKIRMQNQMGANGKYVKILQSLSIIYKEEGIRGLSRGLTASILREMSYSGIRMGAYEPVRQFLSGDQPSSQIPPHIKYLSGLLCGGFGASLASPFDLIKTRFQAVLPGEIPPYRTTLSGMYEIFSQQGIGGLYRGWMVTCARAATLNSAQLGSYDTIKNNFFIKIIGLKDGFWIHFYASMTAGVITTTAANPFDVIKTKYMSDRQELYKNPIDCVVKTFQAEGVVGFFRGWVPAYWRIGPHTVFSILLIEQVRLYFGLSTI